MNHLPGKVQMPSEMGHLVDVDGDVDGKVQLRSCHISHNPQLASGEIEDMIETVDRNKDGKISYSEFRVTICVYKMLMLMRTVHVGTYSTKIFTFYPCHFLDQCICLFVCYVLSSF